MKPKTLYLLLCLLGLALPYSQFVPWILQHGVDLCLFWQQLFANRVSAFFAMDVVASAVTLIVFTRLEARHRALRGRWWVVLALVTVGVSLALPLFLYLREQQPATSA
jgi:hypothetical protein